jgi:DNA-binding NarL/FixJ family response regulator
VEGRPRRRLAGEDIRVVVVDDHSLIRAAIRDMLNALPGISVVGEARDGRQALEVIADQSPSVVLMDITMPNLNGLVAVARIAADFPGVRVLILSVHESEEYVLSALRAGAAGYLNKVQSRRSWSTPYAPSTAPARTSAPRSVDTF